MEKPSLQHSYIGQLTAGISSAMANASETTASYFLSIYAQTTAYTTPRSTRFTDSSPYSTDEAGWTKSLSTRVELQQTQSIFELFLNILKEECDSECSRARTDYNVFESISNSLSREHILRLLEYIVTVVQLSDESFQDKDTDKLLRAGIRNLFAPIIQNTIETHLQTTSPIDTEGGLPTTTVNLYTGRKLRHTDTKQSTRRNTFQIKNNALLHCKIVVLSVRHPEIARQALWTGGAEALQILSALLTKILQDPLARDEYGKNTITDIYRMTLILAEGFYAGSLTNSFQIVENSDTRFSTTKEFVKSHLPEDFSEEEKELACCFVLCTLNQRIFALLTRKEFAKTFLDGEYALLPPTSLQDEVIDEDENPFRFTLFREKDKGKFTLNILLGNSNARCPNLVGYYNLSPLLGIVMPSSARYLQIKLEQEIGIDVSEKNTVVATYKAIGGDWNWQKSQSAEGNMEKNK